MDRLKQANILMESRIAPLEDSKRQRNLRILSPSKAKSVMLENYFWIPKSARALNGVPRDLLLCNYYRVSSLYRQLSANHQISHFEGADLYNDLTRSTMVWRQFLCPVMQRLERGAEYRWGPGRKLSVLHAGKRIHLLHQLDTGMFFKTLGLPLPETVLNTTLGTSPQAQVWDVSNIRTFHPKPRPAAVETNPAGT
ncbi:Hypothetical predicted protein [Pelobates cultripes]|uniref:Uncharacterized protein n=1 Tax=Pelobates cultripes TaxID=61616 RepID=A0AAD1R6H2_PELCU|nr:Hypothetical predicted protein [Pelobates cultripes]